MKRRPSRNPLHHLVLANGSQWQLTAGDKEAAPIVEQLGYAMQLPLFSAADSPHQQDNLCRILVNTGTHQTMAGHYGPLAAKEDTIVVCTLGTGEYRESRYIKLLRLSLDLARSVQSRGGILIHGALAELNGSGVILAAPGGTGKSTASRRLSPPWHSLCDDTTLVVRDCRNTYWAHPWPTWSRFLDGGVCGTWHVPRAVPLKGIFFLSRGLEGQTERIGSGHAVSLLTESAKQASMFMAPDLIRAEVRTLHLEQFTILCALVQAVPAHILHLSLTGRFWEDIERALEGNSYDTLPETIRHNSRVATGTEQYS